MEWVVWVIGLGAAFIIIGFVGSKLSENEGKEEEYENIGCILSINERKFFEKLRKALHSDFEIFSKVRVADIVKAKKGDGWQGRFNKISEKHVDFVIVDSKNKYKTIAIIEVDDKSHNSEKARKSDEIKNKAFKDSKIPLIRVKARKEYSEEYICSEFKSEIINKNKRKINIEPTV